MKLVSILALVGLQVLAVSVPPMPVSPYADTEVSTNVLLNCETNDLVALALKASDCYNKTIGSAGDYGNRDINSVFNGAAGSIAGQPCENAWCAKQSLAQLAK